MAVIRGSEIEDIEFMGNVMAGLATRRRGALEVAVWRNRTLAGEATPPHRHDHEQVIVVLAGRGVYREGSVEHPFAPGDVIVEPAETVHQLVAGEEVFEAIAAMPAGTRTFTPEGEELYLPWAD